MVFKGGSVFGRHVVKLGRGALRQMSRELRDTQAQIDKSHRRCK